MAKSLLESNPGAGLPASMLAEVSHPVAPLFQQTPYVSFVSLKGSAYGKLAPFFPDMQEGDPILILPDPARPVKLDPLRFYLVHAKTHYSEVDQNGQIIRSTFNIDEARADRSLKEHVEGVVLVCLDTGLVPARVTFKSTKVKAAWTAINTHEAAKDTEAWGKLSPEHAATLVCPDPRFRYTTTVKMSYGNVSRSSGFKFTLATGFAKPSTVADWQAITKAFSDEAFCKLCDAVVGGWKSRIGDIEQYVK